MYVSVTSKQSSYLLPPSPSQAQCQLLVSVTGIPGTSKWELVAWHTQVLYMEQEPVAWNLHAWQASPLFAKAPSLSCSGSSPTGSGTSAGSALTVRPTAGATSAARTNVRMIAEEPR